MRTFTIFFYFLLKYCFFYFQTLTLQLHNTAIPDRPAAGCPGLPVGPITASAIAAGFAAAAPSQHGRTSVGVGRALQAPQRAAGKRGKDSDRVPLRSCRILQRGLRGLVRLWRAHVGDERGRAQRLAVGVAGRHAAPQRAEGAVLVRVALHVQQRQQHVWQGGGGARSDAYQWRSCHNAAEFQ